MDIVSRLFDLIQACWREDGTPFVLMVLVFLGLALFVAAWGLGWVGRETDRSQPEPTPAGLLCPWCGQSLAAAWMSPGFAALCPASGCGFAAHAATASGLARIVREERDQRILDEAA